MRTYSDLEVYNLSYNLAIELYTITKNFPKEEVFGIISQIRRASVSVGANIAEGAGRYSNADFARLIEISIGSLSELEFLVSLSFDLHFAKEDMDLLDRMSILKRKLIAFRNSLRK